mmetsp:Transcript_44674/g.43287  ORF Transcript_44674/g.43287 Transcript_44674/m.43287 type:complete len:107 (+) Transcript_44674:96-416(+)|eukprot:CAMPEP_0170544790 /NCGR_PEP_ID=MMETSP0211-20121228/3421_1 /TAXON_ID=311385 /ORGANISM="Pseudokeronopsis sp., Strain OXSARD2" /LENGTH=106 /DNA_ID=CAMNT_0010848529 /DNA_START=95 /DNA_END=415 /DNA_ORIENTATION=-
MIFEEDAILQSLFQSYVGDEEELRKAVLKYCKGSHAADENLKKGDLKINTQNKNAGNEEDDMGSPTDNALDNLKRKRGHHETGQDSKEVVRVGMMGVNDCDLGASP